MNIDMNMKNIGIFTIQSLNYGNRLQNYATQVVVRRLGYTPITFRDTRKISIFMRKIKDYFRNIIKRDRYANFCKFDQLITYGDDFINSDQMHVNPGTYFAILAGSDQIWNTKFKELITVNYFLPFEYKRKIAWAASFGVEKIEYNEEICACLDDFHAMSVREDSGSKIINDLIGKEAVVLVDPTMLLRAEEWSMVSARPKKLNEEGYILTYFLSPKCEAAKTQLSRLSCAYKVLEILNDEDPICKNAGPSEFLWLFEHADLILTDSFHACVFSFLFNKPFIVYDRNWSEGNMNSRLETLLVKFHLERKYQGSGLENDIWEHDYEEGYKQLDIEREKAMSFLKKALED